MGKQSYLKSSVKKLCNLSHLLVVSLELLDIDFEMSFGTNTSGYREHEMRRQSPVLIGVSLSQETDDVPHFSASGAHDNICAPKRVCPLHGPSRSAPDRGVRVSFRNRVLSSNGRNWIVFESDFRNDSGDTLAYLPGVPPD